MIRKIFLCLVLMLSMSLFLMHVNASKVVTKVVTRTDVEVVSRNVKKHTLRVGTIDLKTDRFTLKNVSKEQFKIADEGEYITVTYDKNRSVVSLKKSHQFNLTKAFYGSAKTQRELVKTTVTYFKVAGLFILFMLVMSFVKPQNKA